MDTYKIIAFFVYCFFPSITFSSVYNFTEPGSGVLRSTPLGNTAHSSSGNVSLESGRIRSTPQFTFGTAAGKQVGFTASRLSTISTARVGGALVNFARSTTPLGLGITAATLLCTETDICDNAGEFFSGDDFVDLGNDPPTCENVGDGHARFTNGFGRVFDYQITGNTSCEPAPVGYGSIASCPADGGCPFGRTLYQKDLGVGFESVPFGPTTEAQWDDAANNPALNDDSVVPDLIAGNQPVPVDAPDPMTPQNFISDSQTTTLRDDQGNITGSQVTERRVDITDVSDANNPNSFDITEKKTVTNYDVNNNIVNSETTVINNEQPAEPKEDEPITFDTVEPETLLFKDIEIPFEVTPWGSDRKSVV